MSSRNVAMTKVLIRDFGRDCSYLTNMLPLDNIGVLVGAGVGFAMGYSRSLEEGGAAAISAAVLLPTFVYQECYLKHSKIGVKALYVAFFSGWCTAAIAGLYLGAMNDTMMGAILGPGLTFPCVAIVLFLGSESFYDSDRGANNVMPDRILPGALT